MEDEDCCQPWRYLKQARKSPILLPIICENALQLSQDELRTNISTCLDGTEGSCASFIQTFCQSGQDILPVGPQNTYARCFNANGFKCDFTAWNLLPSSSQGNVPSGVNCQTVLDTVAEVCPQGGQGSITAGTFVFTLDPNTGSCGADAISGGLGSST
ncbi:Y3 protein [Lentinula edodes]|uniref:Y3 protein n=1 Tax=Lentinula edodes TaxID=5353 RepID=A0A1Q3ENI0_LENED|nr:Y3 protein [Lentinula edodes]